MRLINTNCASIVAILVAVTVVFLPTEAAAQAGTTTATVNGRVTDETGGALPGVTITLTNLETNQARTVVSNEEGRYNFSGVTASRYSLQSELQGFATVLRPDFTVNVGAVLTIDMPMQLSQFEETVTVTGDSPIVEVGRTDLHTVITTTQMETLPTASRNYLDFTLLTPGTVESISSQAQGVGLSVGGARPKEAALLVDGFWNTDESFTFPRFQYSQDAIQEFQVISLGGTAEFGRAIGGQVNAVTKSGTNTLRGSAYYFHRDTSLNAQDALSKARGLPKPEFGRKLYGGSLGGPVVADRTFFFGAYEGTLQDTPQHNSIFPATGLALGLPNDDVGVVNLPLENTFWMGKVTHRLGTTTFLESAFVRSKSLQTGAAFQAFSTRSRLNRLDNDDWAAQVGFRAISGSGRWLHDIRAAYFPRDYVLDQPELGGPPLTSDGGFRSNDTPSVNINNLARFGGGRVSLAMKTEPIQVVYSSTLSANAHAVKFGVDVMQVGFTYASYGGPSSGIFTFSSLESFQAGRYTTYAQTFGDPEATWNHTYLSGYIQDSWTATDRLTVNAGIRYDFDWVSKYRGMDYGRDASNVAPRVALSYKLDQDGGTVLKFSNGLYFDRMFENPITSTYFRNAENPQSIPATWLFGQPGAPIYPNTIPSETLPADAPPGVRNVFITPDAYRTPSSYQLVGSIDHALSSDWAATVSLLYNRGWDKELLFDRNLYFDDATQAFVRIDPRFRIMNQFVYEGRAEYTGVVLETRKRVSRQFYFNANATFARAFDQGDNFNQQVNDMRYPEKEYGPTIDTPTFRFVANGSYQFLPQLSVSAVVRARTGFAYDARAGVTADLNGDGAFDDRVPGVTRNQFRMPGNHSVDLRLAWTIPFGGTNMQLALDAFNIYNANNIRTVNNTWGTDPAQALPTFGQTLSFFNPREIQLGARFSF